MYMESVNCGANIAMMTFHGGIIRTNFDKMGMVCIAGAPNVGKTKELKVAMHMASSDNYFFGMKVMHQKKQNVKSELADLIFPFH